jgi:hypothetical protein
MGRTLALAALLAGMAAAAFAAEPPAGWDGSLPFDCELQQAGFEPAGPQPEADPYCVEFDKTRQNVTELGVVEFLSQEPARVAAASDKCFYFQSDHWRGSVVQADGSTKTYEWDGHYFFDRATGDGGVWVTNFNVNGRTEDPSKIPGIPPEYSRYFGPGTGGVITRNAVEAEPRCVEKAASEPVYASKGSARGPNGGPRGCIDARGPVKRRRLGPVSLGERDADVRARLGDPGEVRRGFLRYCTADGGVFLVGQPGDRSGVYGTDPQARTKTLVSTAHRAPPRGRPLLRIGRTRVLRSARGVLVGVRAKRVRWVAVSELRKPKRLRAALRRAVS